MILIKRKFLDSWCPNGAEFNKPSAVGATAVGTTGLCEYANQYTSRPILFLHGPLDGFSHVFPSLVAEWNGVDYSSYEPTCGNTSQYVKGFDTFFGDGVGHIAIDLVRAYDDGVWTSSTQIKIKYRHGSAIGSSLWSADWGRVNGASLSAAHVTGGPNCFTNLMATFTVNDDGTVTVV